jgi:L-fuculose-phosphate aldolase
VPLPEGIHPEAEVFLGRVPMAKFAMPSKPDLPDSITPLIGPDTNTILMGNHGSVSFGKDLIDTYYKLEILDAYCRILLLAHPLGKLNTLTAEQMTGLLQVKQQFGLSDSRLSCAPSGCVGEQNQEFFATFDVQPMTASCSCNGGQARSSAAPPADDDAAFESMVQTITDQIMAAQS